MDCGSAPSGNDQERKDGALVPFLRKVKPDYRQDFTFSVGFDRHMRIIKEFWRKHLKSGWYGMIIMMNEGVA